jgi:hypothetical protein
MEWIKCSERMPELGESVIIYGPEYSTCEAFLCRGRSETKRVKNPSGPTKTKTIHIQHPNVWIMPSSCCNGDSIRLEDITHWMCFPNEPMD